MDTGRQTGIDWLMLAEIPHLWSGFNGIVVFRGHTARNANSKARALARRYFGLKSYRIIMIEPYKSNAGRAADVWTYDVPSCALQRNGENFVIISPCGLPLSPRQTKLLLDILNK